MSSTASRSASELSASTVRTTGAPASTSARVVRLRSATLHASTAKTSSAQATVTMAISRRRAGRRAICRPASADATRPRRRARRAIGPAVGMAACASSSPPAMASRPGASSAIGPPSPVSRVATPAAAAATTAPSTSPTCRVDARGGTRRSREVSGCRRVGVAAATIASRAGDQRGEGRCPDRPPGLDADAGLQPERGRADGDEPAERRAERPSPPAPGRPARAAAGGRRRRCRARAAGPARSPAGAARWRPRRRRPAPRCRAPRAGPRAAG